jgi:hypothetical protein
MTTMTNGLAPLGAPDVWTRTMEPAGYRCQCTGQCGKRHKSDLPAHLVQKADVDRCETTQRSARLVALPAEPTDDMVVAARAPLAAWCRPCYEGALRRSTRLRERARTAEAPADDLFSLLSGDES